MHIETARAAAKGSKIEDGLNAVITLDADAAQERPSSITGCSCADCGQASWLQWSLRRKVIYEPAHQREVKRFATEEQKQDKRNSFQTTNADIYQKKSL